MLARFLLLPLGAALVDRLGDRAELLQTGPAELVDLGGGPAEPVRPPEVVQGGVPRRGEPLRPAGAQPVGARVDERAADKGSGAAPFGAASPPRISASAGVTTSASSLW